MGTRFLTARVAGIAGIVFFVATAIPGFATGGPPDPSDPAAKWLAYFTDHHTGIVTADLIGVLGSFFAIFFFAKLITTLRSAEGEGGPLSVAAIIAITIVAVMATVGAVLSVTAAFRLGTSEHVDAVTLVALSDASAITFTFLGMPLAAFFAAEGIVARSTGRLPAWLGIVYLVAAVLEIVGTLAVLSTTGFFSPQGPAGLVLGLLPLAVVVIGTSIVMLVKPERFDGPAAATAARLATVGAGSSAS